MDSGDLMQSFVEAVTMGMEPAETPREESPVLTNMASQEAHLEEKLSKNELYVFQEEHLAPIFCKPKLIPLKTITTQKLEKMRKELMEKTQQAQPTSAGTSKGEDATKEKQATASSSKSTDVWTADD